MNARPFEWGAARKRISLGKGSAPSALSIQRLLKRLDRLADSELLDEMDARRVDRLLNQWPGQGWDLPEYFRS
ncbi:MAG: hypothetical protein H7831_11335 [Magnetococcus sp. WYHC-3]